MATRAFTTFIPIDDRGQNIQRALGVKWTGLLNTDDGAPFVCPQRTIKTVHNYGTPGAGASLLIEGTNEQTYDTSGTLLTPPNYQTVHRDPLGTAMNLAVAGIDRVSESPAAIRPRVAGGDGTTTWTVTMILIAEAHG